MGMAWFKWPSSGKRVELSTVDDLTVILEALRRKTVPMNVTNEFLGVIEEVDGIRQKLQQLHTTQSAKGVLQTEFNEASVRKDNDTMRKKSAEMKPLGNQEIREKESVCKSLGKLGTRLGNIDKVRSKEVAKDIRNLVGSTMNTIAKEVGMLQDRIKEHQRVGNWF